MVDFGLWGGLVPGHLEDMETIYKLGGGAFKSFMCRCSNYPQTDDGTIIEGLKILSRLGALHAVHAENDTMIQVLADKFAEEKTNGIEAFLKSHPRYSELEAILRYIFILRQVPGSKGHTRRHRQVRPAGKIERVCGTAVAVRAGRQGRYDRL